MSGAATKGELQELHAALAKALKKRIDSGEATAADLNVARALLNDNGIQALATPGSHMAGLVKSVVDGLPFAGGSEGPTH